MATATGIDLGYTKSTTLAPSTEHDLSRDRIKQGSGNQTHMKSLVRMTLTPLTNDFVRNGRCLACKPLEPTDSERGKVPPSSPPSSHVQDGLPAASYVHQPWWKGKGRLIIGGLTSVVLSTIIAIILSVVLGGKDENVTPNVIAEAGAGATTPPLVLLSPVPSEMLTSAPYPFPTGPSKMPTQAPVIPPSPLPSNEPTPAPTLPPTVNPTSIPVRRYELTLFNFANC